MAIKFESVPNVILAIRWGILAAAAVFIFVFDLPTIGFGLAIGGLLFGVAMRFQRFRVWLVGQLTGHDKSVINAVLQSKASADAGPDVKFYDMGTQPAPPKPVPGAPRNYYHDPIEMPPETIEAMLDATKEPAIRLVRHWPADVASSANSWLGGTPNLPEGVDWPHNPWTGFKLHHLAQIDLGEMPLEGDAPLPQTGMLWFFADIDEELDWDAGPSGAARVLYHPTSTKGAPPCTLPDDVPHINHQIDKMTGSHYSFLGPKKRKFPRWPVRGASTWAWLYSDDLPEGVTDPVAFNTARTEREGREKAAIVGPTVKNRIRTAIAQTVTPKEGARPDGSTYVIYETGPYDPRVHGGMFPYHNRYAWHLANWMQHYAMCHVDRYAGHEAYAKKRGEQVDEQIVQKAQDGQATLERVNKLLARLLEEADPLAPLEQDTQVMLDELMVQAAEQGEVISIINVTYGATTDLVADAMSNPALLEDVPPEIIETLHEKVLPSHSYTEHFLLGPKGSTTNPTSGKGVRLAQFGSDYGLGMMFCDCGIVDFWISEDDLAAMRWDTAWAATAGG